MVRDKEKKMNNVLENALNDNKVVLLMCVVFANLGNKAMEKEMENFTQLHRDHHIMRKIIIFCLTYIFTRDFKLSLLLSLTFFIINDILAHRV